MTVKPKLLRQRNTDGAYAAMRMTYLGPVGDCEPAGQLEEYTKSHACDSAFLAERGLFTRAESKRQTVLQLPGVAA